MRNMNTYECRKKVSCSDDHTHGLSRFLHYTITTCMTLQLLLLLLLVVLLLQYGVHTTFLHTLTYKL
jgi:hypothetical protein